MQDEKKPKGPGGRPSTYSLELAEAICEAVAVSDIGLEHVLRQRPEWPAEYTVYQWLKRHEEFAQMYAQARERQGLRQGDKAVEEAILATDPALGRLRYDARRWHAGRLAPRVYGDRVALTNAAGDGDATFQVTATLANELATLLDITPRAEKPALEAPPAREP
jgi:hypothetical protein